MTYPTCKTCKKYDPDPVAWRTLGGQCMSDKISFIAPRKPDQASYGDNDGNGFSVGPDFGCIHHEAK